MQLVASASSYWKNKNKKRSQILPKPVHLWHRFGCITSASAIRLAAQCTPICSESWPQLHLYKQLQVSSSAIVSFLPSSHFLNIFVTVLLSSIYLTYTTGCLVLQYQRTHLVLFKKSTRSLCTALFQKVSLNCLLHFWCLLFINVITIAWCCCVKIFESRTLHFFHNLTRGQHFPLAILFFFPTR